MGLIEDQMIFSASGHAHPVIRALHRREIDDEKKILFSGLIPSDKTENAAVPIIGKVGS